MTLPRFFHPPPLPLGQHCPLPPEIAHHAHRVLRLPTGSRIELFDGAGRRCQATLHIDRQSVAAHCDGNAIISASPPGQITLFQGLASGDKMDWIIEKATESGIHAVVPVAAQRSVLKLSGERRLKREQHWQAVARAACAQSGRDHLPRISPIRSLRECLAEIRPRDSGDTVHFLCDPQATTSLLPWLRNHLPTALALWIGPEGGWSEAETQQLGSQGALAVRYGHSILRTETAGLTLAAASAAVLGWND